MRLLRWYIVGKECPESWNPGLYGGLLKREQCALEGPRIAGEGGGAVAYRSRQHTGIDASEDAEGVNPQGVIEPDDSVGEHANAHEAIYAVAKSA